MHLLYFNSSVVFKQVYHFRIKALKAWPLWAKIAVAAAVFTVVAGAAVGPAVYFGLQGKLSSFSDVFSSQQWNNFLSCRTVYRLSISEFEIF